MADDRTREGYSTRRIVICCERMLMEIGESIAIDSIHWPHLGDYTIGPRVEVCPWCGTKLPFEELEVDDVISTERSA